METTRHEFDDDTIALVPDTPEGREWLETAKRLWDAPDTDENANAWAAHATGGTLEAMGGRWLVFSWLSLNPGV